MVASSSVVRAARWGRAWVAEVFGADVRSLAALRIVLALVVLADLVGRASNLTVHYTDDGVLPRRAALRELNEWQISLNLINGTTFVQALLFGVTAITAVALLVGYRTRLASIVVWVMVVSIQWRNPLVLSDADTLLRVLLFWAMFLPLGARWSVDRAARVFPSRAPSRVLSAATAAVILQVAFMYWFTVLLKSGDEWREDGTALYYALSAQHLTTPLGDYLRQFPEILKALTFGTLGVEAIAPLLLFSPILTKWARLVAIASLTGLHFGILLTMNLGFFPWLSAFSLVAFLPSAFWDAAVPRVRVAFPEVFALANWARLSAERIANALPVPEGSRQALWVGAGQSPHRGLMAKTAMEPQVNLGGHSRATRGVRSSLPDGAGAGIVQPSLVVNVIVLALLVFVFFWNVGTVSAFRMPETVRPLGNLLGLKQSWNMFAPRPSTATTWYLMPGTLEDGREVDLLPLVVHGDPGRVSEVSWLRPRDLDTVYGDKYWRKYLGAIRSESDQRSYLAQYVCRTWNGTHAGSAKLTSLEIVYVRERSLPNQLRGAPKPDVLSTHSCS